MTYFLGRDVDAYITTESATNDNGAGATQFIEVDNGLNILVIAGSAASGACIPPLVNDATILSGSISDVTGIDLSIGVSDEDVGPFLGKAQIMQKVELRKETTVTITRKKYNNFWDVIFNGPNTSSDFIAGSTEALRMGARFGVVYSGTTAKLSDGATWMYNVLEKSSTTLTCSGYRLHMMLKNNTGGEIFTVKNAQMTGHTVSLNADGVTEETIEFTSSVTPGISTPSGDLTGFDTALTTIAEL